MIAAWLGSATATDACSGAGVTNNYNPLGYSNGCGATGMQTVTFTATDSCGNTSTCQAVIEILDTIDPTITCPADTLTLECDSDGDFTILGNSVDRSMARQCNSNRCMQRSRRNQQLQSTGL
ncbi:MAG: hypothetical protein IPN60_02755 [Saprospiraceae bacterium]|nr:hypothetical protein [Candidatus Opimibacter skivensis]